MNRKEALVTGIIVLLSFSSGVYAAPAVLNVFVTNFPQNQNVTVTNFSPNLLMKVLNQTKAVHIIPPSQLELFQNTSIGTLGLIDVSQYRRVSIFYKFTISDDFSGLGNVRAEFWTQFEQKACFPDCLHVIDFPTLPTPVLNGGAAWYSVSVDLNYPLLLPQIVAACFQECQGTATAEITMLLQR